MPQGSTGRVPVCGRTSCGYILWQWVCRRLRLVSQAGQEKGSQGRVDTSGGTLAFQYPVVSVNTLQALALLSPVTCPCLVQAGLCPSSRGAVSSGCHIRTHTCTQAHLPSCPHCCPWLPGHRLSCFLPVGSPLLVPPLGAQDSHLLGHRNPGHHGLHGRDEEAAEWGPPATPRGGEVHLAPSQQQLASPTSERVSLTCPGTPGPFLTWPPEQSLLSSLFGYSRIQHLSRF